MTALPAAPGARQATPRVLLVDDEASVRDAIGRFLRSRGFDVHIADTVASGLDRLRVTRFAALVCDVRMPGASGMDLIPEALRIDGDLAILMLTGLNDATVAIEALTLGAADYLLKPVELDRLEKAISRAMRHRDDRIAQRTSEQRARESLPAVLEAVVAAFEARDAHRQEHSRRVKTLASAIAGRLGLDATATAQLSAAAGLHDIGMVGLPDSVLLKPTPLTDEERADVRRHVEVGAQMLAPLTPLGPSLRLVREHHEHWDGSGYPSQLAGDAISVGARILAVADAYVAVTAGRPYCAALSPSRAIAHLAPQAGKQFDPSVFRALEHVAPTVSPPHAGTRLPSS